MTDLNRDDDRLLWLDWETWGLGAYADIYLEMGFCITDWDVDMKMDPVSFPIRHDEDTINGLPESELFEPHKTNGLLEDCVSSRSRCLSDALASLRVRIDEEINAGHRVLLAGNSVAFDRDRTVHAGQSVGVPNALHGVSHRMIDMSCIWECYRAWHPDLAENQPERTTNHRSINCLKDGIALARFWRDVIGGRHAE